ncbi:THUMP-like domain-containing protein [Nonomuraea zeae]|uniref:Methyltransferase domain-containing protein n=1 Tax=Nonomuraea zeae TaxID=1642303 RepID=A0A5S4FDQ1_9ACTN|nr:methyltransferase domain-containing protein [Nonomuraea zeae]TMR16530.1 methyltransferase domain-containing protein [Nonomuraea zeae]
MDLDAFTELLTPRGQRALAEAGELTGKDPVAAATTLRKTYDAALTSAALTQAGLRERAKAKFGADAERMYFTPHGLEQSTRAEVAEHRARRLVALHHAGSPEATQAPRVVDACCGIGGDLLALARAGCTVTAVDTDPLTVAVARANVEAFGLGDAVTVTVGDAAEVEPEAYDVLFADPARRTSRGRTFDPMAYSPPWPVVLDLAGRARLACLKVAPGIPYEFIPEDAEAEWVSYKGEVKEAALWIGQGVGSRTPTPDGQTQGTDAQSQGAQGPGEEVRGPGRRATLLPGGHTLTATGVQAPAGPAGRYVYEPDGAAIRAHLVGEVTEMVNGRLLDPMIAYITGDAPIDTPWASRYEIEEVMPFSLKRLRTALRERQIGNVTIKKRGSAVDIERLRSDLRLNGKNSAVIILTRIADKPSVLICDTTPPA